MLRAMQLLRVSRQVCMLQVTGTDNVLSAKCRRVYSNAHTYHINSVSLSSDQETFLSADDLRINLWHLNQPSQSFNLLDIKPANMEDLTEVGPCCWQTCMGMM